MSDESEKAEKHDTIAKLNKMIAEWQPRYCRYLLGEAEKMHDAATAPPPIKNKRGREFCEHLMIHARDTGKKALCGHKGADQLVSKKEFEKLPRLKCKSCKKSLMKLKGEDYSADEFLKFWIRDYQKDLILTIFHTSGQKVGQWCTSTALLPQTNYKTRQSLRIALRRLERHGVVEIQRKGKLCHVRLTRDCIRKTREGHFCVSF